MPTGVYVRTQEWIDIRRNAQKKLWEDSAYYAMQSRVHSGKKYPDRTGEKSWMWIDGKPKTKIVKNYTGIHHWVRYHFGRPMQCVACKRGNLIGKKIHWANISGEYKRERGDWIRLCVPCHWKFGRGKLKLF